ncbi:hypothetical protein LTR08_009264 [Meristemomyces frigidus]|nr:hypothetical protein LTR08_009264 [Meristemomyces frigidus]
MNMATQHTGIPLHCNICSKKPDFSDVSHLLTHVASKGHLSSFYRMKVQGTADPTSQKLVDEYEQWYSDWSVDDLMRDRMSQKDKRRGGGGATVSRRGSAGQSKKATLRCAAKANAARRSATTASARSTPAPLPNNRRPARQLRDSVLNPRLDRNVKGEPKSRSATPASVLSLTGSLHRAYAPPMQSWPSTPYGDPPVKIESIDSSMSNDSFDMHAELEYGRPTRRRARRRPSESIASLPNDDEWEMDETITDATKLKGVLWPGMALFDSATPEMKRKRNQKKDYSVMEQLKATSEYVEPNEMIFDADGNLRKQRVITGNPDPEDDESLLSGEASPEPDLYIKKRPARPTRRPRPALTEKNVNTGRTLRRRQADPPPPRNRKAAYYDEEDDDLTYGQPKARKRTGLSIHRDNSGPEITFNEQAGPLNYLTTGYRNPFQPDQAQLQHQHTQHRPHTQPSYTQTNYGRGHQRVPSFTFGGQPFGASFRPAAPANHAPAQNFSSFGHLNTQSLFQNSPYQVHSGQSAFAAFQQQFGATQPQHFPTENTIFQNHNHGANHSQGTWDMFAGLGQPEGGFSTNIDAGFQTGPEMNPLFFSSNQPTPAEDDAATISPPASEH